MEAVINDNPIFNDSKNWLPYGGNKGNFGTFESQQNSPAPALIEKITNSIDATLIKECKTHGITKFIGKNIITAKWQDDEGKLIKKGGFKEIDTPLSDIQINNH